jgi:hypothetical protein
MTWQPQHFGSGLELRTSEPVTLLPLKLRSVKASIGYTLRFHTVRDGRYVIQG